MVVKYKYFKKKFISLLIVLKILFMKIISDFCEWNFFNLLVIEIKSIIVKKNVAQSSGWLRH